MEESKEMTKPAPESKEAVMKVKMVYKSALKQENRQMQVESGNRRERKERRKYSMERIHRPKDEDIH